MTFKSLGDNVAYSAAHLRIANARGPASDYACHSDGCSRQAQHWSYNNSSTKERVQLVGYGAGCRYSPDPEDYDPMCVSCHKTKDMSLRGKKTHCMRDHEMTPRNTGSQGGCLTCRRGRRRAKREGKTYRG